MNESAETYETVSITVRVPKATADRLAQLAERNDRTLSAELRRALRSHLEAKAA